jgi:hypothetical protein
MAIFNNFEQLIKFMAFEIKFELKSLFYKLDYERAFLLEKLACHFMQYAIFLALASTNV